MDPDLEAANADNVDEKVDLFSSWEHALYMLISC